MRAHKVCTQRRAKRIICCVWVTAVVYCSPWLVLTTTKPLHYRGFPDARACDFKRPRDYYLPYYFTDLIVFYLVPLVVSCVLYGLIARTLLSRKGVRAVSCKKVSEPAEGMSSSRSQVSTKVFNYVLGFFRLTLTMVRVLYLIIPHGIES